MMTKIKQSNNRASIEIVVDLMDCISNTEQAFISTLSTKCGMAATRVRAVLKLLVENGWIDTEFQKPIWKGGGDRTHHKLTQYGKEKLMELKEMRAKMQSYNILRLPY